MSGKSGAVRAGRAFVEMFADNSRLARDLKQGVAMMRRYASTAKAIGQSMITSGLKLAAPFAIATAVFVGFEDQMAEVRAVTQATAAQFKLLTAQSKELGRTTSFTAKAVASAQAELGRAGFNPSDIRKSTASILSLARGTKTELSQAAQIGADSLRAFRLEAKLMPQVADVLTATTNNSSQGLVDLFEALKTVGPVAADVGATITDTAAAIGVLANNGIKGTLAGNALKRAYLNLADPSIRKKIEGLTKIKTTDAAGNLRPLASVISEIGKATAAMPNAKRLDIFSQIFGDRAVVAASAFAGSAANFTDLQGVLDNAAGTAARTAKMMDDTLGGSFRRLASAAEGIAIAVGEAIAPAVGALAETFTKVAGAVTAFVEKNRTLVVGMAAGAAALIIAGTGLVAVGVAASVAASALSGLGTAARVAFGVMPGLLSAIVSPARLAFAGLLAFTRLPSMLMGIPLAMRAASKSMERTSLVARALGKPAGKVAALVGRTLTGAMLMAVRPIQLVTSSLLGLAGTLMKTAGILAGKVATSLEAASVAMAGSVRVVGSAGRGIASVGRGAVLASTALVRSAGRGTFALMTMGMATGRVTLNIAALSRAMLSFSVGKAIGGLKMVTQTMGGLAISAFRAARSMVVAVASIRAASVVSAVSSGLSAVSSGFSMLSMGALRASMSLGKAAKAAKSAFVLTRLTAVASSAGTAVSAIGASLFGLATSPGVLFAALAGGIVAATVSAVGGVGAMRDGLQMVGGVAGIAFRQVASQAGDAWGKVKEVATRAVGAIVAAIKSGDMEGAFAIAMSAIKLAWAETVNSFSATWAPVKVALTEGMKETAKLMSSFFGGSVDSMKDKFSAFAGWFGGEQGMGSATTTTADVVAAIASMWATGWSNIEQTISDAKGGILDAWDSMLQMMAAPWNATISKIVGTWERLKGLFDGRAQYEIEADIKRITGDASIDPDEAGKRINDRASKERQGKKDREETLKESLDGIESERERRREEELAAVQAEKDSAQESVEEQRVDFEVTLIDAELTEAMKTVEEIENRIEDLEGQAAIGVDVNEELEAARGELDAAERVVEAHQTDRDLMQTPIDAAETTGQPAAAATEGDMLGVDPVSGKGSFDLLADWVKARDESDRLKGELSGANRNKGINPETGRGRVEINKEYQKARAKKEAAGMAMERVRAIDRERKKNAPKSETVTASEDMAKARKDAVAPTGQRYESAARGVDQVQARLSSSVGTFSARAGGQSGAASSVMNRVAKAAEEAVASQKEIATNTAATAEAVKSSNNGIEAE